MGGLAFDAVELDVGIDGHGEGLLRME
jgi:hypothetical protein